MPSHHGGHGGGGPAVAEVVKDRASVVVNEVSRGPVNNEIIVANRERDVAVVPAGAQVINEVTTTEVFPGRPGFGGSSYGYGSERCVYCERLRFEGPGYHHGGVSICRDRYGRPALCRPRRVLVEKKTVKKYYY
ncbi:hypothetical protein COL5a_000614 [Colletotrichum fioriniae]|uniref:uncharacterized protein n=1 Tax=Colletotrichum fioriniae TaxID=710243 RepID=UPI0032DA3796|nr:hypothetical protein COL5a_000614 [Colletotrichum fioriniae]KAJ3947201.1 hypothetical protein N0V96_003590 [Colletotrichum fioriniae]